MLLRQVQARPLQGHRLRALRRRGDPLQGAPRAHGPHRPGRLREPHLVLQGRSLADRLPDRHGSQGAGEGPLLRRLGDHLGRRGGPHEGLQEAREGGRQAGRGLRRRARAAHPRALREPQPPPRLPGRRPRRRPAAPRGGGGGQAEGQGKVKGQEREGQDLEGGQEGGAGGPAARHHRRLQRGRRALGRHHHQREADEGRGPREDGQGAEEDLRGRDLRHRELSGRSRRPAARGLEDLQRDEAQGRDQRRDHVPRAQGSLRLTVRLGRVLPRRHGRRVRARAAGRRRPGGRGHPARGDDQHLQGPEAGPRREAPEGGRRLPQVHQQARLDGPGRGPGDPARAAPDGAAGRRPVRNLRPQRPLSKGHQQEQPPQAAARPGRARDHRQQREAHAAGGRRRPVRQRPPRPPGHRSRQPPAEVAQRHAQGQAGPVPPEPARQAG